MKLNLLLVFISVLLLSCTDDKDEIPPPTQPSLVSVQFSVPSISSSDGRTASATPKAVLVTILNSDGSVLMTRKELTVYKVGSQYLSLPLTFEAHGQEKSYKLHEFMVIDANSNVTHITPKEGSILAYLVSDPVDINFVVNKDVVTTVEPEVVRVEDESVPADFGYSQFKMGIVETIHTHFASLALVDGQPTFAEMQLEITATLANGSVWRHERTLEAKLNSLILKKAVSYKIKATKPGFQPFEVTRTIANDAEVEIILQPDLAMPAVTEFLPPWGRPGDMIIVRGSNFGNTPPDNVFLAIGPYVCHSISWNSNTELTVIIGNYNGPAPRPVGFFPMTGAINGKTLISQVLFEILPPPPTGN
jgi:hypothetical protein